ncbi:S1 family peptidase [Candidatus Spongiihabitans sp.]|uniref:S1 family peptidase n=1 Tax=Candidatus Spongiihabitans sp. TaxID=3101308 RepID=UPI003C7DC0CD
MAYCAVACRCLNLRLNLRLNAGDAAQKTASRNTKTMFAKAYSIASCFTLPVVISSRSDQGECKSTIGACVVVNRDGWILTSAHLIKEIQRQQDSSMKHSAYGDEVRKLEQDTVADKRYRKSKVRTFQRPSKDSVRNHSVWWGRDGAQLRDLSVLPGADLALGRLQPFDPDSVAHYPAFKNPATDYAPGRSLCRLGFPFHEIKPTFDQQKNAFVLPQGAVPLPLFPLEGIFTRVVIAPMPGADERTPGKFIETSSPGLMGQSGGPIVDAQGVVWALQSHTRHYPLGFSPPVPGQGKSTDKKEHQFLNVGLGVHAESILQFLTSRKVAHQSAD